MRTYPIQRAPGVFVDQQPVDTRLRPVRLDVAAFAGIAPRGPARQPLVDATWTDDVAIVEPARPYRRTVPVRVESWTEYEALYGGRGGPGRLGAAVASFFDQGGRAAWILRIVHDHGPGGPHRPEDNGASTGTLSLGTTDGRPVEFVARSEGTWGDLLRLQLSLEARPIPSGGRRGERTAITDLDAWAPVGSLLRCTASDGSRSLHWVVDSRREERPAAAPVRLVDVDTALPLDPAATAGRASAPALAYEIVEAAVDIVDLDPTIERAEHHAGLGLTWEHPRWLAKELSVRSALVLPGATWAGSGRLAVFDPRLPNPPDVIFVGGVDHADLVTPDDFFDPAWVPGAAESTGGLHALIDVPEAALLVTPDLYEPVPLSVAPAAEEVPPGAATFEPCEPATTPGVAPLPAHAPLAGLELDPRVPADLARIISTQERVVAFAEGMRRLVVLLDVPPGLTERRILQWRQHFATSYAAAYHPWLLVPDGARLRPLNPSAAAAGVIASREHTHGVPTGPANHVVLGVADTVVRVLDPEHDRLHTQSVNVYRREPDGLRLMGARTLSRTTDLRQLSVRRLITLLTLTLERRLAWTVFEPNDARLRDRVGGLVTGLLRDLFAAGAFAGATEEDSFFVRAGADLNPARVRDAGQFIVEIGIAPAEPIEFLIVRLHRAGDGTLTVDIASSGTGRSREMAS